MAEEKIQKLHKDDIADALYEAHKDSGFPLTRKQTVALVDEIFEQVVDSIKSRRGFQLTNWFTVDFRPKEAQDVVDFHTKEARHNPRCIVPRLLVGKGLKEVAATMSLTDEDNALLDAKKAKAEARKKG